MPAGNAGIVREGYEAWNEGGVEAVLPFLDPEVEVEELAWAPGAEVFHGHDGFRALWEKWLDAFEWVRFETEDFIEVGDDVVVPMVARGKGRGSGAEARVPLAHVWTLRDGKGVKVVGYNTKEDALRAVGLEP